MDRGETIGIAPTEIRPYDSVAGAAGHQFLSLRHVACMDHHDAWMNVFTPSCADP